MAKNLGIEIPNVKTKVRSPSAQTTNYSSWFQILAHVDKKKFIYK